MSSLFSDMSHEEADAYIEKLSNNYPNICDDIQCMVNELGSSRAALQTLCAKGLIPSIEEYWPEENELGSWAEEVARQDEAGGNNEEFRT